MLKYYAKLAHAFATPARTMAHNIISQLLKKLRQSERKILLLKHAQWRGKLYPTC
jgi:hypothetical protein